MFIKRVMIYFNIRVKISYKISLYLKLRKYYMFTIFSIAAKN